MQTSLWFTVPKVSYYSLHGSGSKQCFVSCLWISILPRVVVIDTSKEDKKHCQSRLELSLQCFRRNALSIFTVHNGIHEEAVREPLGIIHEIHPRGFFALTQEFTCATPISASTVYSSSLVSMPGVVRLAEAQICPSASRGRPDDISMG